MNDVLITKEDFEGVRHISKNIDFTQRVLPYAKEAQNFDLRPYLGDALFYDLMKNQTLEKYQDLLNGKEYQDTNGNTIWFDGIKEALAYYAMARFRGNQQISDTNFSVVIKTNEFSEPVSDKTIVRTATELKSAANALMYDVVKYIKTNISNYPLYETTDCCKPAGVNKMRITGVSRTS